MRLYSLFSFLLLYYKCDKAGAGTDDATTDFIQEKSVEEFKRSCPYTDLCFSTAGRNLSMDYSSRAPCCQQCHCDYKIQDLNCPDRPERFLNADEVLRTKQEPEQCVHAQLRRFSLTKGALNGLSYGMMANCPADFKDVDIKAKCSRDYDDFDFDNEDIGALIPVSSKITNVSFRNYYCTSCHDVLMKDLVFWKVQIKCRHGHKLFASTLKEIHSIIKENTFCQVVFVPPHEIPIKLCLGSIDRCNLTGTWQLYDDSIESACMSYTSVYKEFKNIHCFVCNGRSFSDIVADCLGDELGKHDASFVALLDFNNLEGPSNNALKKTKCPKDFKYDQYLGTCRLLSCPFGMMLSKEKCVPTYEQVIDDHSDSIIFGLQINMYPDMTRLMSWRHLDVLSVSIWSDFITKIYLISTTHGVSICNFHSHIHLRHSLEDTLYNMTMAQQTDFVSYVSHVTLDTQFSVQTVKNITEVIEEMSTIFTVNDRYAQYFIKYPAKVDIISFHKYPNNRSEEYIRTLTDLQLDVTEHFMFVHGLNDPIDGLGILWFLDNNKRPVWPNEECDVAISLQPHPFCSRIEFKQSDFNIDIESRTIISKKNSDKSQKFTFSKILVTKQNKSVFVCSDEYFSQILSSSDDQNTNMSLVILSVVCLVPSLVSLLFCFLCYCLIPKLRNAPGLNTMALVLHLLFAQTLTLVNIFVDINLQWLCAAIGICLHFTLVASFFWMFICTFHMMHVLTKTKPMSSSTHPIKRFIIYLFFVEITSGLLVGANILTSLFPSAPNDTMSDIGYGVTSCYIDNSKMILYTVAVPLGFVLVANVVMFVLVVVRVSQLSDIAKNSNHERQNMLIFAKLSTLTGATWVFGFLYQFFDVLLFAYLYIVFNAGEGIFILFSFIINKRVLDMLHSRCRKRTKHKSLDSSHPVSTTSGNGLITQSVSLDTKF